jgi:hypothetical protein
VARFAACTASSAKRLRAGRYAPKKSKINDQQSTFSGALPGELFIRRHYIALCKVVLSHIQPAPFP